jgi:hypothetical protein
MNDAMFEARLERAARRYADEALRPIDAVAIATGAMRTRSLDKGARSSSRWSRAGAAIAALVVAIAGISFLVLQLSSNVGQPPQSPSPTPTETPIATAAPSAAPGPVGNGGTWLADKPDNLSFGSPSGPATMAFTLATPGLVVAIDVTSGPSGLLRSGLGSDSVGNLVFTTIAALPGTQQVTLDGTPLAACVEGDEGHYESSGSAGGMLLTLTAVSEECPSRLSVFARTWSRSLGVPGGGGGAGVVDAFEPPFTVDLPTGNYLVDRSADAMTIHQDLPEFQFMSFKDPQGFLDPCDRSKGRYDIAPGADSLVAYFRQLAGFTVDSTEELTVDGLRAVKLVVHANDDASCPDGRLWEWQPKAETSDRAWFVEPGVTDSLYIVEHPKGTLMFEVLPAPNALEQQVIGTIQFLDALPTSP